jgi:Trk K+ transport system NAD-binding subunit
MIARTGQALGAFTLGGGDTRQITEVTLAAQSPLVGKTLAEVVQQHRIQVVAHVPAGQPARFVQQVDNAAVLRDADRVVVVGTPTDVEGLLTRGANELSPELLWGNILRRLGRVFYRGLSLVDLPVKICTAVFLWVIVLSVFVFHIGMKDDTWIDAFYRTISLMTTGADMRGHEVEHGSWQKAFISSLKLIGTALTAAFTAIFTNYLIRANLGGALELRRIPESGHIIVCGLGNVGFRVVQELRARGEPVVAIEQNAANAFIPTARRLGAAVLIGNAAVTEVLKQAHAATARAIVTATSNELLNLEIALLARDLAPATRVIMRLTDPHLAMTLREAADIRFALSIPELTAPAFVASMYGNQVLTIFQVAGRLLAVYAFSVQDVDAPLVGMTLQALTQSHGFLAIHHTDSAGAGKRDRENFVDLGDQLTGIIALENVQRLFHRETSLAADGRTRGASAATGAPQVPQSTPNRT